MRANIPRFIIASLIAGQVAISLVFVTTGIAKLQYGTGRIVAAMNAVQALSQPAVLNVARALPYIELALGLWLASGLLKRTCAWLVLLVLLVFTCGLVLLGSAIGWTQECGCMGPFTATTIKQGLYRNAVLILMTLLLLEGYRRTSPRYQKE